MIEPAHDGQRRMPVRAALARRERVCLPGASVALAWALAATACGGARDAARSPTVFDAVAGGAPVQNAAATGMQAEHACSSARADGTAAPAGWVGVCVLHDGVRFLHPPQWTIRSASTDGGRAFVRYVSPAAYSFAVYERSEAAGVAWHELADRYENDVAGDGATVVGRRVPMATRFNQGRAYTVERKVEGWLPVVSRSREILLRGKHRVAMVQIVTADESFSRIGGEVLEVLNHLEVL